MDIGQIGAGIDAVFAHEASEGGAVFVPIMLAQAVRLGPPDVQGLHHPVGHPHLDLVEEAEVGRVKRVVEVKDPSGDMVEMLFHDGRLAALAGCGNGRVVGAGAGL